MELAVFSDIHGNHIALRHCLRDALARTAPERPTLLFLGDYMGEFACPQKTLQLLYDLAEQEKCVFLRGNREDYWLNARQNGTGDWQKGDSATGMMLYNYSALRPQDLDFFAELPAVRRFQAAGLPPLLLCHGSPRCVKEKLFPGDANTNAALAQARATTGIATVLCGHTHRQERMEAGGCLALNPGSVGLPDGAGGAAYYLLLHGNDGAWQPEFVTLPYDQGPVLAEMDAEGLDAWAPAWYAVTRQMLRHGAPSPAKILARAMYWTTQKNGGCTWPHIPEDCWRQALAEFGLRPGKEGESPLGAESPVGKSKNSR